MKHLLTLLLLSAGTLPLFAFKAQQPAFPVAAEELRVIDNYTVDGKPVLIPEVQKYSAAAGKVAIPAEFTVSAPADAPIILRQLARELKKHNSAVKAVEGKAFCRVFISQKDTPENPQGYRLTVGKDGIVITSRGAAGLFYGVQTLRNLIRNSRTGDIAMCSIEDWPDMDRRGYFFTVRRMKPADLPKLKNMLDTMASLRINWLLLEFAESFPYKGNPLSKSKNRFTEAQVRDLVAFCRERHIEITPLLQVWSHALWMTFHPDWLKMREGVPNKAWNNAPCPLNKQARELTEQAVAEQIEMIKPKIFCLTMDEIGLCPYNRCKECRKRDFDQVTAEYFKFAENLCYSRGVQAMICQDELFNTSTWPHGEKLRGKIDRRNNILWWTYKDVMAVEKIEPFVERKMDITGHAIHSRPFNTRQMAKLMQSVGSRNMTVVYWYFSGNGLLFDLRRETANSLGGFVNSCDYMWKLTDRHYADFPYDGALEMMRRMFPERAKEPSTLPAVPLPLHNAVNAELSNTGLYPHFKSDAPLKALNEKLASMPEKFRLLTSPGGKYYGIRVTGDPADKTGRRGVAVRVNRKAQQISLLMTASAGNDSRSYAPRGGKCFNFPHIADVMLVYADGSRSVTKLKYRRAIAHWNQPYSGTETRFVVRGVDDNKEYYSLGAYDLKNPHPERTIRQLVFMTKRVEGISPVLLAASLRGADKPYGSRDYSNVKPAAVAKRAGVRAGAPKIDYQFDFSSDDLKGAYIYTTGSMKKSDVKMEIVNDPTAPNPGRVLKISVPPAALAGTGDAGLFVRISFEFPCKLSAGTKTLSLSHRLSHLEGFSHSQEYLVEADNKHYWRRVTSSSTFWNREVTAINLKDRVTNTPLTKVSDTAIRKISYFFHKLDKPLEIYLDDIGTMPIRYSSEIRWRFGEEPTIFR